MVSKPQNRWRLFGTRWETEHVYPPNRGNMGLLVCDNCNKSVIASYEIVDKKPYKGVFWDTNDVFVRIIKILDKSEIPIENYEFCDCNKK